MQEEQILLTNLCATTRLMVEASKNGGAPMSIKRGMADGASLVCSDERTRWPVRGRVNGDFHRFSISDFTDHDNVGILTQKRAQTVPKSDSGLGIDLRLIDPRQFILNRVFNGRDVHLRRIQNIQNGVKGRGLAVTSRAGYQNHAVRFF